MKKDFNSLQPARDQRLDSKASSVLRGHLAFGWGSGPGQWIFLVDEFQLLDDGFCQDNENSY